MTMRRLTVFAAGAFLAAILGTSSAGWKSPAMAQTPGASAEKAKHALKPEAKLRLTKARNDARKADVRNPPGDEANVEIQLVVFRKEDFGDWDAKELADVLGKVAAEFVKAKKVPGSILVIAAKDKIVVTGSPEAIKTIETLIQQLK